MTDLTLYLLRHGESVANVKRVFASLRVNPPLSDAGVQQITAQAESLKDIEFSAIYASPALRAQQTAGIVGKKLGLEPITFDSLQEIKVGDLEGKDQDDPKNWKDFMNVIDQWNQGNSEISFPRGESLNDVEARLRNFFEELSDKHQKPVLVVGHCLLFMSVFWLFCGRVGPKLHNGYMGRGHFSVISGNDGDFSMLKFNVPPSEMA